MKTRRIHGLRLKLLRLSGLIEKVLFIRTDCAWCGKVVRRPLFPEKGRVSHTMCRACAAEAGMVEVISH